MFRYVLTIALSAQSCAILDGYKDNQHSWYAEALTDVEKELVDRGQTIEWKFDAIRKKGKLIIMKGDPKFGKYNFVEVGNWEELIDYSRGDFVRGQMCIKTMFDDYGNILSRTVHEKRRRDSEFHNSEIWTSEIKVFDTDSILLQHIKTFNKDSIQTSEFTLGVLNRKQNLSDRLKTKIRIGRELIFDDVGNVKKETYYQYKDKVEAK